MNNLAIEDIKSPIKVMNYMWKKCWVRSHESLWSVMRNFRIVNGHCSYSSALKMLGITRIPVPKQLPGVEAKYGIYSRYTIKTSWEKRIDEQLLPEGYAEEIAAFSKLMCNSPQMISHKIYYCPKCMEYGYHSYLHQLSGIRTCPFHDGERLLSDYMETYVWGESRRVDYDRKDNAYMKRLTFSILECSLCDFNDKVMGRLPHEWKESVDFMERIEKAGIYDAYDSLSAASSAIGFSNTDILGGSFFLEHRKRVPIVSIYDIAAAEAATLSYLKTECSNMGFKAYDLTEWLKRYAFNSEAVIKLLLLIFSRKLLKNISTERIRAIEGNLLTGGQISYKDHDDILVLFLWDYLGCRLLHAFTAINDFDSLFNEELKHYSKRYCAKRLMPPRYLYTYGVTAAMHIIRDHMKFCYQLFREHLTYLSSSRKEKFGLDHDLELFSVPTYITTKRDEAIYIFRET